MSTSSADSIRELALTIFETVLRETESLREQNVGADLAYLLGAILTNNASCNHLDCERDGGHEAILAVLADTFPPSHEVWTFIQRDSRNQTISSSQMRRARKAEAKADVNPIEDALFRCRPIETKSIEEFLDSMLDEDLDVLAQLPGTPGQVLAAQFSYYVRSSTHLTESLQRDKTKSQPLIETIHRLPEFKKRRRNSRSPDHDPAAPDPEAAA
jgi:hypothetical protein